tara:strand:- start:189 stop:386 length:198 start_codon:yes stop_codon:yes gene_type:complete
MNEDQLVILKHIRNAVDDMFDKLNRDLYEKSLAAKVSYTKVRPADLVAENLEYIVSNLDKLKSGE